MDRSEVPVEDKWNVEALYPSMQEWEKDLALWGREDKAPHWPELNAFKGKLHEGPQVLRSLLDLNLSLDRHLSKIYTYAHLRHDEDVANDVHKKAFVRITALLHEFRQETSWIEPEILGLSDKTLQEYLQSDALQELRISLEKIIRLKTHTLSNQEEELLALAGQALDTSYKTFSAFNNADLKFPSVKDSKGELQALTHAKYMLYMKQTDRTLRENAFHAVHTSYLTYENTIAELINGQVQRHLFDAKARKYNSCLEAALFPNQIDTKVYTGLIDTVSSHLKILHKYMGIRKKILGVPQMHLYDLHVPLVADVDFSMDYVQAEQLVVTSVACLGKEYQETLRKGLLKDRWVDRYENARKRSGAYSSGCYDSMPYILMNYQGTFSDVLTLSHEAGHSMHSFLSNHHQAYVYSHYVIFVAEVASTFHEELLIDHLLEQEKDKKKRAYLINQKIEDIRSTFFRQTLFAEFELLLHTLAEKGMPLTTTLLKEEYRKLNVKYFGPDVVVDDLIDIEWSRIPHFYYNFYVYQYATGISAAHALVATVKKGGEEAVKKYLNFLSSGSSKYPLELLQQAGVDMRSSQPVLSLIQQFGALVDELEKLLSQ